jgi:hypothetical protein
MTTDAKPDLVDTWLTNLPDVTAKAAAAQDQEAWNRRINEGMAPYREDGVWAHAPQSAREDSLRQLQATVRREAAAALTPLDEALPLAEGAVQKAVAAGEQAPALIDVCFPRGGPTIHDQLYVVQAEKALADTFTEETAGLPAHKLRERYEDAVRAPGDVKAAAFVAWLEARWRAGRLWQPGGSLEEAADRMAFRRRMDEVRAGRVPARVRALQDAIDKARKVAYRGHEVLQLPRGVTR